jgi:hypothetical protein
MRSTGKSRPACGGSDGHLQRPRRVALRCFPADRSSFATPHDARAGSLSRSSMKERVEVAERHSDGVEHANMPQLAARTELVDGGPRDPQVRCDLPDRQQRPQPVRRILGDGGESRRRPGLRGPAVPSGCEQLRRLATPWAGLIRPSKPRAAGSTPARRATQGCRTGPKTLDLRRKHQKSDACGCAPNRRRW